MMTDRASFLFRCDAALLRRLDMQAEKLGISRNEAAVRGLSAWLALGRKVKGSDITHAKSDITPAPSIIPAGVQLGPTAPAPGSRLKSAARPKR